jgi:uncharacterized protein (DUF983 family)
MPGPGVNGEGREGAPPGARRAERARRHDPEELSPRRAATLYRRALLLRCPHCGARGMAISWFRMRERCASCGLRSQRGEEDFFLGSMMFNLILSEGLFALLLVGWVVAVWPDVPWGLVQVVAVAAMIVAPFVFLPFSRLVWLASDILIRPVTLAELETGRRAED